MKSFKWLLVVVLFFSGFFIIKNYVYSTTPPPEDLSSIPLEGEPRNLAINPYTDQALVTSTRPNELSVVDLNTGQITTTLQVKKKPFGLAIDCGKNLALVSFKAHHRLSVIDLSTYHGLAEIPVGKSPCNVAVYEAAGGPHLGLTANYGSDTVSVINLETFRVIKTLRVGRGPRDIAVDPGLKLALVVNEETHNVAVIDLNSLRVTGWVPVGRHPRSISINPETHLAAVANGRENYITTIDLTNWQSLRIPVDKNPLDVAINPLDNRALVVCNKSHSLQLIDLDTHTTLQKYPLNRQTRGVAVNPFTNIAGVVDRYTDRLTLIQLPNPVPDIQSISPVTVLRGSQGTQVSIQGSGFIKSSTVTLQPSPTTYPVIFVDNHNLTATLPAGFFTQAGSYQVTVNNPAPDGGPSNTRTFQVENPIPTLTALDPASAQAGGPGMPVKLYGSGFFPETTILINGQARIINYVSGSELELPLGPADLASSGDLELKAFNPGPGGGASNPMSFTVTAVNPIPVLSSMGPNTIKAGSPGFTLTLTGSNFISSSSVLFNNTPVSGTLVDNSRIDASIPGTAIQIAGSFPVVVQNPGPGGGSSGTLNFTVTPASNATPLPDGSYGKTYEDLIPPDATIPSYDPKRFSLITGLVKDGSGNPLAGVAVGIHGQSEYGTAQTDATGRFSIPLDGGGTITVAYQKTGFIPAHRQVQVGWNTIANVETIVLIPEDTATTAMTFDGNAATILTHKSTPTTDSFGSRSLTMVLTGDNRAWVKDVQGNEQAVTNITVRATEYPTPESMPAKLPPTSAFTYCAELSVDGAKSVRFEKPVVVYVDNFLGFNVGEIVPVGYYDRDRAVWVPSNNGVVVQLLDTNGDGVVDAYTDGQNQFAAPGLTDPNQYRPGTIYWRVEHDHFTSWDYNWPFGFPMDAIPPNNPNKPITDTPCPNDDKSCINSYVENRNRIFHEDISIPGTDMTLHYASNRTRGYKSVITIPVSGPTVPASLKNIVVKMEVAGRTFETILPPGPNQQVEYVWDGLDYLGRQVSGSIIANIGIGFIYRGVYFAAQSAFRQSFGQAGGFVIGIRSRQEVISWNYQTITIPRGGTGVLAEGWTLSSHHFMNPVDPTVLHKGNGTTIQKKVAIISSISGDGMMFSCMERVLVDSAGNSYMSDRCNHRILKLDRIGNIIKIINLYAPSDMAEDSTGNLYVVIGSNQIVKVDQSGNITTFAGNGQSGYGGDSGPATQASLNHPSGLVIDNAGNVYIADSENYRVRKVDPNGIISTIAGNGQRDYSGDQGPATEASIGLLHSVAVDHSGNIYLNDNDHHRIRKVAVTGIITTLAGNGQASYSGDGGPAVQATLFYPVGVSTDKEGNVYIADGSNYRVRKVDSNGIITTIAGNGQDWTSGDGGPATQAGLGSPLDVAVDYSGNLYIAVLYGFGIRKVALPEGYDPTSITSDITFSEETGQGYVMDSTGLHKSTIDLATGKTLLTFGYDSSNKLISITDQFGNQTTFQRDGSGTPLSITSPDGIITRLTVDGNNHLTAVTFPDNSAYSFAYNSEGLLTDTYDPKGNHFSHQYDAHGMISNVSDPEGGSWNFNRSIDTSGNITVTLQTAEGNTTTYQDQTDSTGAYRSIKTDPAGSVSTFTRSSDGLTETQQPSCGMNRTWKYDLDPSYKYKYIKELTQSSPAGLTQTTTDMRSYQDTNGDTILDWITRTLNRNGNNWTTINNTLTGTLTSSSPMGRTIIAQYDPSNLLTTSRTIPGLYDTDYTYDTKGRLTSINRNARVSIYGYNPQGFLASITDPENNTTTYSYDTMGRVIGLDGPNGYSLNFTYDLNGNMTVLTNPSLINHGFGYNTVNLNSSYQTPLSGNYGYLYDKERNLIRVTFPSGILINNIYSQGHLIRTETPEGNIAYNYLCSLKIGNITKGTEGITYTYDGSLITSETLSGSLNQVLGYTYNNDFNIASLTYSGQTMNYTYDNDGLLTGAGSFIIGRNATNGLPTSVNDGALNLTRIFNGYEEEDGEVYNIGTQTPLSWSLARTETGRISSRTETVDGTTTNFTYNYDPMGRILTAARNGSVVEEYRYSLNGTRIYEINALRGITGRSFAYSAEDHLLTAGNVSYQYNLDGFLTSKTQGTATTSYQYSSRGELLSASLPDGRTIEYLHDPLARRTAKKIDGTITEKYLWQGRTRLLAVYDGSDNLLMRFNYADGRMPVSMMKDNSTYYLAYDQIGSLKAVIDFIGNVIKRIDYDSFGNIINDNNPSFSIPFGFAGGLHDRDIGLVRFGYRDYSPEIGRWIAKDPIQFRGGDMDLFAYVQSNPVNWVDPNGLACGPGIIGDLSIFDYPGGNDFSLCCKGHDSCYGDCKKSRKQCDNEFRECMGEKCLGSSNPACDLFKNLFTGLVGGVGGILSYEGHQGLGNYPGQHGYQGPIPLFYIEF